MRYCLFGASFDPPHIGHIEIIKHCINLFDKIIIMPVGQHPNKNLFANKNDRFKMAEIVKRIIDSDKIILDDYEIKGTTNNYTFDTIKHIEGKYQLDSISLIIGSDQLNNIRKWYKNQYILSNYQVYCFVRKNVNVKYKLNSNIKIIRDVNFDVSSSKIRNNIKFNKKFPGSWLSEEVWDYIEKKNIYR